jgi:protein TonB
MTSRADRWKGATGAATLQGLMLYGFLSLSGSSQAPPAPALLYISPITPEPVAKPVPSPRAAQHRQAGKAAPPNRTARPVPVVTPPPIVPMPVLPPPAITAAPVAAQGTQSSAGATPTTGPGTGAGGQGDGLGSGDSGNGPGDGSTWSEWKSGRIRDRDYPAAAFQAGIQGVLRTRYTIGTNGRVIRCEILETSGSPLLDETTCRLVMERYRYRPARNAAGKPVVDVVIQRHHWELDSPLAQPPEAPPPP